MTGPRRGRRGVRRGAVFIAAQLVLVVLLAEVAVRFAAPRVRGLRMLLRASTDTADFSDAESLQELMSRSMLGFAPGTVQFGFVLNSRSFRTREYRPEPAPDRFRVVALGDSFTFASGGIPHGDHWTTVLEGELGRRIDRPVEVLRLGVPDTGPAFQLRLWQIEAARLAPDVVVLAFFVGNDFVDHQGGGGPFVTKDRGLSGRLASASMLYRAARNLVRVLSSADGGESVGRGTPADGIAPGQPVLAYRESFDPDRPTFSQSRFVAIEGERMALCLRSEEAAFDRLARRVSDVVVELAGEVRASGARCLVMVIPDQYQVDPQLVDRVLGATGGRRSDYDFSRPQRVLTGLLDDAGVEVLDLLPALAKAATRGAVYRPRDTHWNRRGNAVAAAHLANRLIRRTDSGSSVVYADGLETGDAEGWSWVESGTNVRFITPGRGDKF